MYLAWEIGRRMIAAEFPTQGSREFELLSMESSRQNNEFDVGANFLPIFPGEASAHDRQ